MVEEGDGRRTDDGDGGSSRVIIGSSVISILGITFGSCLIVAGSELTWRSDHVLGLFNQSGWSFSNVIHGDGKITIALGVLLALGLTVGAAFQIKTGYGLT